MRGLVWGIAALAAWGCVTPMAASAPAPCDPYSGANCPPPPPQLTDEERAEMSFGDECAKDVVESCVRLGRLLMEEGKLNQAEVPLHKAYREENADGALALADLSEARGDPARAQRLRWEALSIDKANSETTVFYRPGYPYGNGAAFTMNLQPMAFFARRFNLGFELDFVRNGVSEVNGFAGYQHYFNDTVVGYAQVLLGGLPLSSTGTFNYGAECGVKLVLGAYGGITAGFGGSRGSPAHAQIGISFNSLIVLIPLALMASR